MKQLEEQKRGGSFNQQQRHSQVTHPRDQIGEVRQIPEGSGSRDYMMSEDTEEETKQLEHRRKELLRRQQQLIEQKRQVQKEQEEIEQIIKNQKEKLYGDDRDYDPAHYCEEESKVKRFMKLANALYVCDQDQTGKEELNESTNSIFCSIQYH